MTPAQAGTHGKLPILGLLLLAFLAYSPSLGNGFALDDSLARAANQGAPNSPIAELHSPVYYFTSDYWAGFGTKSGLYRPTTIYSLALTHFVFGGPLQVEAFAHHLLNVLLNCWAVYLVWWWMLDLGIAVIGAFVTAALFAVHGIHSEVVATVIGRGELLAFCFGMAGLQALRRSGSGRVAVWIPLSSVLFFLAFCSKESALAWAALVPCYLAVCGGLRATWLRAAAAVVPAIALYLLLRHMAVSGAVEPVKYAANPLGYVGVSERLVIGVGLWGYGLFLCLAPFSLTCLYGPEMGATVTFGLVVAVAFPAWLAAALWNPARRPGLFLSAAWFFGFGFITSNLPFAIGTVFGERLYFIPSLGVCMLPALLLPRLTPAGRKVLLGACALWAASSVVVDVQRSFRWKDNETLLTAESEAPSGSALLQITAGKFFHVQEYEQPEWRSLFHKKAWECVRRAKELDPEYVDVYATEAGMLERSGKPGEAIEALRKALALRRLPFSGLEANLRKQLGRLLSARKDTLAAGLEECRRSLALQPTDLELRVYTIDAGNTALPADALGKLIDDGLTLHPGNVVLLTQKADYLFRHPARDEASTREVVEILAKVFRALPRGKVSEPRFVIGRMQYGDGLVAIRELDAARRVYRTVLEMADAPAPIRAKARSKLRALGG
jgi:tetratricopeptide (TPR) repeat protein